MKQKLWSFGTSHTAGEELGSGQTVEQIKEWFVKNTGCDNSFDAVQNYKIKNYEFLSERWFNEHGRPCNPELSYAGKLSLLTNRKHISRAISGCGIDRCFHQLLMSFHKINWENDIVLFECPPVSRYMTNEHDKYDNLQLSSLRSFNNIPSNPTMDYLYVGIINYIKTVFPKIHIISIETFSAAKKLNYEYATTFASSYFETNSIHFNDISMEVFAIEHVGKYCRMPGFHFSEEVHEKFAKYLFEKLNVV